MKARLWRPAINHHGGQHAGHTKQAVEIKSSNRNRAAERKMFKKLLFFCSTILVQGEPVRAVKVVRCITL